ncbi:hypothetical protein F441_15741 [Phytophthora nicotianae CJ01A1]|uniref:Uncharacterized protein n=5 Tax=Phytophthora nicotianae TaxID=4792 RepID=W2R2L6_PHYN3|nr:hypothetical protein PPTG_04917 [Phytophthora nicotianae INRA-310]ETK78546.1 hypothetical protein L915_15459 [Phytophthora nicotianae]ETO67077.1 hypothetical protein F444_15889 [Phytophthora nicotianae P1976]ETP08187.1 hypothetical protein F441_15741 [Phytophthora nicotianae CJ01A1]ETP36241.1 hypothetical protein F442_15750 [Phytophthora nicotianae P10297]KUF90609.1 hypothetical protein AM587_10017084 [Phytophthora nicotianae]
MRRPKRSTPHTTTRLRWMESASPGVPTPNDLLVSWLERNGEAFRTSKRKLNLLEQLGEEMATNGIYGLTISSIRSQICRLKKGVQMRAEGGKCTSTDANHYYDRLLLLLFSEEERISMRDRAAERSTAVIDEDKQGSNTSPPPGNHNSRRTRSRSRAELKDASDVEDQGQGARQRPGAILQPVYSVLDTTEIRRRFELLSARQGLKQQGVDRETIDSLLPLHQE